MFSPYSSASSKPEDTTLLCKVPYGKDKSMLNYENAPPWGVHRYSRPKTWQYHVVLGQKSTQKIWILVQTKTTTLQCILLQTLSWLAVSRGERKSSREEGRGVCWVTQHAPSRENPRALWPGCTPTSPPPHPPSPPPPQPLQYPKDRIQILYLIIKCANRFISSCTQITWHYRRVVAFRSFWFVTESTVFVQLRLL